MADLPLKSGKLVVLVAWLFLCCCRIFRISPLCLIAKQQAVWLLKFENVDQIFNLGTESLVLLYFVARWKVS